MTALGERWAHVCKWIEERWAQLRGLSVHWGQLEEESHSFNTWIKSSEDTLTKISQKHTADGSNLDVDEFKQVQVRIDINYLIWSENMRALSISGAQM